jgi:hypothetical protein
MSRTRGGPKLLAPRVHGGGGVRRGIGIAGGRRRFAGSLDERLPPAGDVCRARRMVRDL